VNRSFVIDCSVSAAWFLPQEQTSAYESLLSEILDRHSEMIIPDLWWYEVMNVIRSAVLRQRISENDAQKIFLFLRDIPKRVIEMSESGQFGILKLAMDENLSVYDATYLFLAISTGSQLITADQDLLSLKNKYAFIREIPDFP
jgi:predicted nucleic acid-binding protein